jgi:hypothetical protein
MNTSTNSSVEIPLSYSSNTEEFVPQFCDTDIYKKIRIDSKDRWFQHPDQMDALENNGGYLYFDMKPYYRKRINPYSDTFENGWFCSDSPMYRHNFESDVVVITFRYYLEGSVSQGLIVPELGNSIEVSKYIPNTKSIVVYRNGIRLSDSDFVEYSDNIVHFPNFDVKSSDVFNIQFKTATLTEGTHYHNINHNIIRFKDNSIFTEFSITEMDVWGFRANKEALNPIKLIDKKSKVVINTLQNWHPVHGHHFVEPYKNIDFANVDVSDKFARDEIETYTIGNKTKLFKNMDDESVFDLSDISHEPGSIELFLNGAKLRESSYIEVDNTVTLVNELISSIDVLEATTIFPVDLSKQTFTAIPNHPDVVDGKIFTFNFNATLGAVSVFLNGVKLSSLEYIQTSQNTFELANSIKSVKTIVEISAYLKPTIPCDTFDIDRKTEYWTDVKSHDTFILKTFSANIGEMRVYVNGYKLTEDDFYQVTNNSFKLNQSITSSKDIIEVEAWKISNIKQINKGGCKDEIIDKNRKIDFIIDDVYKDFHLKFDHRNINQKLEDPAVYLNTLIEDQSNKGFVPWGKEKVGTIWLDTNLLHYKRYHDTKCFPDCSDRIKYWGELADWAECRVYEWVESEIAPEDWDQRVYESENNSSILESQKKSGTLWMPLFEQENGKWVLFEKTYEMFDAQIEGAGFEANTYIDKCDESKGMSNSSGYSFTTKFRNNDDNRSIINVYVNGILILENINIPTSGEVNLENVRTCDRIYIVRMPTNDEAIIKDLLETGVLRQEYQYTQKQRHDEVGAKSDVYYFWVRNKKEKSEIEDKTMTVLSIEDELVNSNSPYFFFQNPVASKQMQYEDDYIELPWRMIGILFRGLRGTIDANRRYTIRFTRDFTLRDHLNHGKYPLELKNLHQEWRLFRKDQNFIIDRNLWNKITESIVGRKISNKNVPIPSYDRQIYDKLYDSNTRFGLGEGQTFTNGELALSSVIGYLTDRNNDFYPFKIDDFFANHSFETEERTIEAMDSIYSLVPYNHVNNIFFSVLHDALSMNHEYADIIKTSWVSLHSIAILNDQGRFDD